MDLSEAVDELYSGDPEKFVARRKDLAAAARADKDRALATDILALRRPTRGAWLVNLLARTEADGLGQLLDLGPALAEAHTAGSPAGLRELTQLRRRIVASLVDRAVALGLHRGYDPTPAVRDEVARALDAALTDPAVAAEVRAGSLAAVPETAAAFPTHLFAPPPATGPTFPGDGTDLPRPRDTPSPVTGRTFPADGTDLPRPRATPSPATAPTPPAVPLAELRALLKEKESAAEAAGAELASARDAVEAASAAAREVQQATVAARARLHRREADESKAADAVEAARAALVAAESALAAARVERTRAEADLAASEEAELASDAVVEQARAVEAEAGAAALRAEADVVDARANLDRAT